MGFGKFLGITAGVLGGIVLAPIIAPAIGAAASAAGLGVAAGTLSGAAASSAGLAALGGGSLAAGGLGVAGGTAVVAGASAVAGGVAGSVVNATAGKVIKSVVDNCIRETVICPHRGSVVYCNLAVAFEHTGIYIGGGKIAHLNGDGEVEAVTPTQFIERLSGCNPAISIYVSCNGENPVGSELVASRAENMVGKRRDYNCIFDNCHQFTAGCLTGKFDNPNNFFWMVKDEAKKRLDANDWRVWDLKFRN